ncbi:hypothetical protein [Blastococcus sp. LR1]|uniref:hypothetical protein n=1 Tax=Blastococcus sp. LR1 TaxID=2877000 RepID=UPI001CCF903D|nr:hypothetical protein [Blastococcus sp. LR1]MCA0146158.1 hypothetical protein [Blastococcus sp. LR1]
MFRSRGVVADGVLTRDELRSAAWKRLFHGIYADAELPESFAVDTPGPIEMVVPPGSRFGAAAGLRVRRAPLPITDVVVRGRFRCTSGLRTALDIGRLEPLMEAVPALDQLLAAGVVSRTTQEAAAGELIGGRGVRRCRQAVSLLDERAESPPESRLRVLLALAGMPARGRRRMKRLTAPGWRVVLVTAAALAE